MKKTIVITFLLMLLLFPFNVDAAAVESTTIMGSNEATVGEELSLSFIVKVSGIQKGNAESLGILVVAYELIYDETVFIVTDISSKQWNSDLYEEKGKYYIYSEVSEDNSEMNKCVDGILYCADYLVTVNFYVRNTDKTSSVIGMGDVEVGLLNMIDLNKNYTEDDIILISGKSDKSQTIKLKKPESVTPETKEPASVVGETKPNMSINTTKKSGNNYLTKLEVENYEIKFDKDKKNYYITVDKDLNELDLKVELEDDKATYKVIGADNLKDNNYKVLVEVTAENGQKKTYTISVRIERDKNVVTDNQNEENKEFRLEEKHIIIGGIVLFVIIIIVIIIKIKDRKIDKAFDNL